MPQAVQARQLVEKFPELLTFMSGDLGATATSPAAASSPTANSIVFVNSIELFEGVVDSPVAIIVIPQKAKELVAKYTLKQTILLSPNVKLAMALVNQTFFPHEFMGAPVGVSGVHPTAVIAPTAKLGKNITVGPYAVISQGCTIGDNTTIGANTVIEPHTRIGSNCVIHPLVYIAHSCQIGSGVHIKPHSTIGGDGFGYAQDENNNHYKVPHYGPMILEDDVHIGANVSIDRGTFEATIVRRGTKLDNHIHIAHNNQIGSNCLLTAGFISAGSTTVGNNCTFAGRSSLNGHINITDNVTIGPLGTVAGDITESGAYMGFPAIPMGIYKRAQVTFQHLPTIRKNLARVMKHLGLEDKE